MSDHDCVRLLFVLILDACVGVRYPRHSAHRFEIFRCKISIPQTLVSRYERKLKRICMRSNYDMQATGANPTHARAGVSAHRVAQTQVTSALASQTSFFGVGTRRRAVIVIIMLADVAHFIVARRSRRQLIFQRRHEQHRQLVLQLEIESCTRTK